MKRFVFSFVFMLIFSVEGFSQNKNNLKLGGYAEVVFSRNFYSDDFARYAKPEQYKNQTGHGTIDIPHFVLFMNYDFGKGWSLGTEIEFEHSGVGAAYELEAEETGEYEQEIEKGGEITLEEMWIQKRFSPKINLRMGHMVVPIGGINAKHSPTSFFTNYRPEGERTILPSTWHQTGIGIWGNLGKWKYTALLLPGLDAYMFSDNRWIGKGATSPFEFKIANTYAAALRLDNYSVQGLQIGLSAYTGQSAGNTLKGNRDINGTVRILSADFSFNKKDFRTRGGALVGWLTDSESISVANRRNRKGSPSPRTNVASQAMNFWAEAGYNLLNLFEKTKNSPEKLYLFATCNYYDSMHKTQGRIPRSDRFERTYYATGLNYFPTKQIALKAEYGTRRFNSPYNPENSLLLGVSFTGLFIK